MTEKELREIPMNPQNVKVLEVLVDGIWQKGLYVSRELDEDDPTYCGSVGIAVGQLEYSPDNCGDVVYIAKKDFETHLRWPK